VTDTITGRGVISNRHYSHFVDSVGAGYGASAAAVAVALNLEFST
jgi:hypothetical protein